MNESLPQPEQSPRIYDQEAELSQQPQLEVVSIPNYNTSSEHPRPVNYFDQSNIQKQRGIEVTETTLGGKPFFIAERPGPKESSSREPAPTTAESVPADPDDHEPATELIDPTEVQPNPEAAIERSRELDELYKDFVRTRDNYAKISAGRGKRGFIFKVGKKDYSKEALRKARDEFDSSQQAVWAKELEIASLDMGLSGEELERAASAAAAENQWQLANAMYEARMPKVHGSVVGNKIAKTVRSFYELWNDKDTSAGKFKKTAAYAAAGFAVGVPVGIVAGPIIATVAGGALGVGIAKRVARNRMALNSGQTKTWVNSQDGKEYSKKLSNAEAMYDTYNQNMMTVADNTDATYPAAYDSYMLMDTDTESHVGKNARDFKIAALAGAIGGVAGGFLGSHVLATKGAHVVATHGAHHHGAAHGVKHHGSSSHHSHKSKPLHKGPTVNPHNINNEYVSQVYEHAEGLHPGFTDMVHAANLAQHHGLIQVVHPQPGNPNLFYYKATKAGAKLAHMKEGSPATTADIVKILSHFSKLKVL